jgi:hypothetical protein
MIVICVTMLYELRRYVLTGCYSNKLRLVDKDHLERVLFDNINPV